MDSSTSVPDHHEEQEWHEHCRRAVNHFRDEGIAVAGDVKEGEDCYIALRREWQAHIPALTDYLEYDWNEICPDEQKG